MLSEGVGSPIAKPDSGYEEIVVEARPDKGKRTKLAVSLRIRETSDLLQDSVPSLRYMNILREGRPVTFIGGFPESIQWP